MSAKNARIADLRIVDRVCRDRRDEMWLMLVAMGKFTLLPELYEVIGGDRLVKFLEIFGGTTIQIPPRDEIINAARSIDIFTRISTTGHRSTMITRLSEEYDITEDMVMSIFRDTAETMHGLADIRAVLRAAPEVPDDAD